MSDTIPCLWCGGTGWVHVQREEHHPDCDGFHCYEHNCPIAVDDTEMCECFREELEDEN